MMSNTQLNRATRLNSSNLRYIKVNKEDKLKISMIKEIIKIDIGQIVRIGEYCSMVGYNMDRITETDPGIVSTSRGNFRGNV